MSGSPMVKEERPPGAWDTRVEGRSESMLPQFWLWLEAHTLEDGARCCICCCCWYAGLHPLISSPVNRLNDDAVFWKAERCVDGAAPEVSSPVKRLNEEALGSRLDLRDDI